jgi:predicted dinucleotide-binding enzyme
MKIAIIGAGNVGGTLGRIWAAKGHEVAFGIRRPNDAKVQALVTATGKRARAASVKDAVTGADVVVLATPWSATEAAIKEAGELRGKVVVDATNPLKADLSGLAIGHSTSAAEQVAGWAPGARVVKAFNTIGAVHMADPLWDAARQHVHLRRRRERQGDSGASGGRARLRPCGLWAADSGASARTARYAVDLDGLRLRRGPEHRVRPPAEIGKSI